MSGWINASIYRIQVHGRQQSDGAVRSRRPARRDHRQEILGSRRKLSARRRPRRGSCTVHRRLRISARRAFGIRVRRLDQRRADRSVRRTANRAADSRFCRDRFRGPAYADERGNAARGAVRRVHRLLRRRSAARSGDGSDRDPSPQRSDPARLAADEAAALSFRRAVPRGDNLEQSRSRRHHRHRRRLAACLATDDGGRAAPALRRPCQAGGTGGGGAQLHGAHRRGRRRGYRSVQSRRRHVGGGDALRAGGKYRHIAQRLELGARSAHPAAGQGTRRDVAFEGDHRGLPAVFLDRQISAAFSAVGRARRGRSRRNGAMR